MAEEIHQGRETGRGPEDHPRNLVKTQAQADMIIVKAKGEERDPHQKNQSLMVERKTEG